ATIHKRHLLADYPEPPRMTDTTVSVAGVIAYEPLEGPESPTALQRDRVALLVRPAREPGLEERMPMPVLVGDQAPEHGQVDVLDEQITSSVLGGRLRHLGDRVRSAFGAGEPRVVAPAALNRVRERVPRHRTPDAPVELLVGDAVPLFLPVAVAGRDDRHVECDGQELGRSQLVRVDLIERRHELLDELVDLPRA